LTSTTNVSRSDCGWGHVWAKLSCSTSVATGGSKAQAWRRHGGNLLGVEHTVNKVFTIGKDLFIAFGFVVNNGESIEGASWARP
jgi:hypothetical protein